MALERITFVSSDIVDSTGLKERHALTDVQKTFSSYHSFFEKEIKSWSGEIWTISGDGIDFFFKGDNSEQSALGCAYSILKYLNVFNLFESSIDENIEVRISIGSPVVNLTTDNYGKISDPQIDKICKVQKNISKKNQIVLLESSYQHINPKIRKMFNQLLVGRDLLYVFSEADSSDEIILDENLLKLTKVEHNKKDAKDFPLDLAITPKLHLILIVKLAAKAQRFTVYYSISTDKNENRWIGYSKQDKSSSDLITKSEYTVRINQFDTRHVIIVEPVLETIMKRFPNLTGGPKKLLKIRFRADKSISEDVIYYYGFFEKG